MTCMKNEEAQAHAEKYRNQVLDLLRAKGYEISSTKMLNGTPDPDHFLVKGEPQVSFGLLARSATRSYWATDGTPDLEFVPGYGTSRRRTHWKEPDKEGWNEKTAAKHAAGLAEFIETERRSKKATEDRYAKDRELDKRVEKIRKQMGREFGPIGVYREYGAIVVKLNGNLRVSEEQVVPLVRDLYGVLKTYGLDK